MKPDEVNATDYLHIGDTKSGFWNPKSESSDQVAVQALTAFGGQSWLTSFNIGVTCESRWEAIRDMSTDGYDNIHH